MFWGCFIFDYKGLCHVYYTETPTQKAIYKEKMDRLNKEENIYNTLEAFKEQERLKEEV
jgi:hypothetical protein